MDGEHRLPGDQRTMRFPTPAATPVPFGHSGGETEAGTDHCRTPDKSGKDDGKPGYYLFNLTADLGEQNNLAGEYTVNTRVPFSTTLQLGVVLAWWVDLVRVRGDGGRWN